MDPLLKLAQADPNVAQLLQDVASADRKRQLAAIAADPAKYRSTTVFKEDPSYRFYRGKPDGYGREVRWCWSTNRNAAGYFLTWREVWSKKSNTGKRDRIVGLKTRRAAKERALTRRDKDT